MRVGKAIKAIGAAWFLVCALTFSYALVDNDAYLISFEAPLDTVFIAADTFNVNITVTGQDGQPLDGLTPVLTVRALAGAGGGTILVNAQDMTGSGSGAYTFADVDVSGSQNAYLNISVTITVDSTDIQNSIMVFHGAQAGTGIQGWKIEYVSPTPTLRADSANIITVALYRNNGTLWTGQQLTLTLDDAGNNMVLTRNMTAGATAGQYTATIPAGQMTADEDYVVAVRQGFGGGGIRNGICVEAYEIVIPMPVLIPVASPTTNRRPPLRWHPAAGAGAYTVQVDTLRNFNNPVITVPVADTFYTPTVNLPIKTIYWRVSSDLAATRYAGPDSFVIQDPNIPVLIVYTPDSTTDLRPTLMWHKVTGASAYTIQIDTMANFASPMLAVPVADTFYTPTVNLPQGKNIYWRVRSDLSPTYSATDQFYIIDRTIVQLIPVSPNPTQDATPTLRWHAVAGADSYRVQIDNTNTFRFGIDFDTTIVGTTYTPAADLAEQTHYWRVRSDISTSWSDVGSFTIVSADIPLLVTFDGAVINDLRPTFQWHPVDSAAQYTIQISYSRNMAPIVITTPTSDTFFTPLVDLEERMVYWRVRSDRDPAYSPIDSLEISTSGIHDRIGQSVAASPRVTIFPNPFKQALGITVLAGTRAQLSIYDINGKLVRTLNGTDRIVWDGTTDTGSLAQPGMYMVKAVIDGKPFTRRVILTR